MAKTANCSIVDATKRLGTFDPNANYEHLDTPKNKFRVPTIEFADTPKDFTAQFAKLPSEVPPQMIKFLEEKSLDGCAYELGKWRWHPKGTFKCWPNQEGICIPYFGVNGEITTFRLRRYDRMREKFGHPLAPKGVPLQASYMVFDTTKPVYFCEGESDSLSMRSIDRNVICLPGVGARKQLHSAIMDCFAWNIPKIIFCGDNDDAGRAFNKYAIQVTMLLGASKYVPQLRILKLPDEYNTLKEGGFKRKDINDFLKEGRLKQIIEEFEMNDTDQPFEKKLSQKIQERQRPEKDIMKVMREIFGEVEELPLSEIEGIF